MKKKFYISLLSLVFFLSTTALPVTIHMCGMVEKMETGKCKMCMAKKNDDSNLKTAVKLSSIHGNCCTTFVVDSKIKDNFLTSDTIAANHYTINFISPAVEQTFSGLREYSLIDKDNSPPITPGNSLYLFNSIFLI